VEHDKAPVKRPGAAEGTRSVDGVLSAQAVAYVVEQVQHQSSPTQTHFISAFELVGKERMHRLAQCARGRQEHGLLAHHLVCTDERRVWVGLHCALTCFIT